MALRQAAQRRAAATEPWLAELQRAAQQQGQVFPHVRLHVLREAAQRHAGLTAAQAYALEQVAHDAADGRTSLYMPFVQQLLADDAMRDTDAFTTFCQAADAAHTHLSAINAQRDAILQDIAACKFELEDGHRACPKCKCRKLLVDERQTRGADEETTKFYTCTRPDCGFRFR